MPLDFNADTNESPLDEGRRVALDRIVDEFLEQFVDEMNFEAIPALVVGDAVALARGLPARVRRPQRGCRRLRVGSVHALAVRGPNDGDGPMVTAFKEEGAVTEILIDPMLGHGPPRGVEKLLGALAVPSGRLVIGSPRAVRWWGECDLPQEGLLAETLIDHAVPAALRDSYAMFVRLAGPTICTVTASLSEGGGTSMIAIRAGHREASGPQ